ncbi:MAG: MoaD/ThiS family protein [Chloroflexi bacterium]|nr:MoaD/ThiS family protein [Chloroflexota bacterium]
MRVHVKLTEPIWRTIGARDIEVEMPGEQATVGAVLGSLAKEHPKFAEEIYSGSGLGDYYYGLFLNDRAVNLGQRDDVLARDGDEVFILLPIAGGSLEKGTVSGRNKP